MNEDMLTLKKNIKILSSYSKDNSKVHGEVFTPFPLIEQMLDSLPKSIWSDPSKTFFDPCAGKGNMPAVILERLMKGLSEIFPDENNRYKHILENQIYMAECQRQSARDIDSVFNPKDGFHQGELKLNLYVGDTLQMPKNFWDLPWEERKSRYPQHHVWNDTPEDKIQYVEITAKPLF